MSNRMEAFAVSFQGPRPYQEDEYVLKVEGDTAVGAIFDGHGGGEVSKKAKEMFPTLINPGDVLSIQDQFQNAFKQIHAATQDERSGAVAVAFMAHKARIFVSNVGDAEAVVVMGNSSSLITKKHGLGDPEEAKRVVVNGGRIHGPHAYLPNAGLGLMPTRSLGDHIFPWIIQDAYHHGLVTPEPYYLVVASDGLWDVVKHKDVPSYCLGQTPKQACERLAKTAAALSHDNVTIIVVKYSPLRARED